MIKISLSDFAGRVREKNRISFGDVQRLQRDVLPDGIASREDAETLLGIDREVTRADVAWSRWLVAALVDFVVWAERPTGVVDEEMARWLAAALAGGGARHGKTARLIAREIAQEAQAFENDALAALAAGVAKPRASQAGPDLASASLAA